MGPVTVAGGSFWLALPTLVRNSGGPPTGPGPAALVHGLTRYGRSWEALILLSVMGLAIFSVGRGGALLFTLVLAAVALFALIRIARLP